MRDSTVLAIILLIATAGFIGTYDNHQKSEADDRSTAQFIRENS